MGASQSVPETSVHEFIVKDCRRKDVDLSIYKGKVLLVVNVAQHCIHTNTQYTRLTELHKKHKDKGFEILAFPCNQFFMQSPGTSDQAKSFACERYKAEYPIFRKVCVNGSNTAPIYKYLKANSRGNRWITTIKWNFTKFLVDVDGKVIKRYSHLTDPLQIEDDILNALGERAQIYY